MITLIVSFIVTIIVVRLIIPVAKNLGWVDKPGDHRMHQGDIPLCGGLAMIFGFIVSAWALGINIPTGLLMAVVIVLAVGVIDDRIKLPYLVRFVFQVVAVSNIIFFDNVRLSDLGYVFSEDLASLGNMSDALTIFAVVGVVNAINMVDGVDGLAGGLVLVCLCLLLFLGFNAQQPFEIELLLIGVVLGFLCFNLGLFGKRVKVFMGDAGSTSLGVLLAWLLVSNSQLNVATEVRNFVPVLALWLLAVPLFDAVGVLLRRMIRGGSPFKADRLHTHHLLQRMGYSSQKVLLVILTFSLVVGVMGILLLNLGMPEYYLFYLLMFLFLIYILLMEWGEYLHSETNTDNG